MLEKVPINVDEGRGPCELCYDETVEAVSSQHIQHGVPKMSQGATTRLISGTFKMSFLSFLER